LVSKRVKDGLREQVDLMQAQMTEISAKEAVKSAQNEFTTVLEEIAVILHRPVLENDIKTFSKESFSPVAGSLDQNLVFASMKAKEQLQELSLKNAENSIMPTVTLEASYETNNYDLSSGEAISGGRLGEDNDVWKLGLNATWAIGLESERSEKEIQSIERQKAIYQLGKVSRNNLQLEKSFKSKLAVLEQNLKSAAKRNELAHKVLKEYNRLYSRGRASLDQVINAEEELIRTQSDYARYRAQYGTLVLRMHNLYGILKREVLK
jgi:outer membrane protein TolC